MIRVRSLRDDGRPNVINDLLTLLMPVGPRPCPSPPAIHSEPLPRLSSFTGLLHFPWIPSVLLSVLVLVSHWAASSQPSLSVQTAPNPPNP